MSFVSKVRFTCKLFSFFQSNQDNGGSAAGLLALTWECRNGHMRVVLASERKPLIDLDLGWTKVPHRPRVIWKIDLGVLFHLLYLTITNSQRHKKRVLIVIHFNPSSSFFYTRGRQPFRSRGPKTNSARYGGPYQFSTKNYGPFAVYAVKPGMWWNFNQIYSWFCSS